MRAACEKKGDRVVIDAAPKQATTGLAVSRVATPAFSHYVSRSMRPAPLVGFLVSHAPAKNRFLPVEDSSSLGGTRNPAREDGVSPNCCSILSN